MKKLLHERLRECGNIGCTGKMLAKTIGCKEPECVGFDCSDCIAALFDKFADEIERDYIPKPRMDDGTPFKIWEWYYGKQDGKKWQVIGFRRGAYSVLVKDVDNYRKEVKPEWLSVHPPQPKVLDADGVEIKVGDTVWCLTNGYQKGEVRYIYSYGVQVEWEDGYRSDGVNFDNLTHKEPDSIKKIQEYAEAFTDPYIQLTYSSSDLRGVIEDISNRLSALIERGA